MDTEIILKLAEIEFMERLSAYSGIRLLAEFKIMPPLVTDIIGLIDLVIVGRVWYR